MDIYYTIEEKYLQAIGKVYYGRAKKGLQLLNEIVANDPFYGKAHFQLGKLHYYEINDYQASGYHFKTCMELEPSFPDVYYHFLHLLVFLNMEKQVQEVVEKAVITPGVDLADIYELQALFFEKNKNWPKAAKTYKKAFFEVTDKTQKQNIEESLLRVKEKKRKSKDEQYEFAK